MEKHNVKATQNGTVASSPNRSTQRYPLLLDALRLLPGIGPRHERERLGEAKYLASRSATPSTEFNGVPVQLAELQELFIDDEAGRPRVSPCGARLLIHLHNAGAFAGLEERGVQGNLEVLARYAEGLASVLELNYWRGATHKARPIPEAKRQQRPERRSLQPATATAPERVSAPSVLIHRLV
jgi:hypothetical protein